MATPTTQSLESKTAHLTVWNLTTADPTGDPIDLVRAADRTVQVIANVSGSAMCEVQGSNDYDPVVMGGDPSQAHWSMLHMGDGATSHSYTDTGGCELIAENPRFIRVVLTTVGVGADWGIYLVSKLVR